MTPIERIKQERAKFHEDMESLQEHVIFFTQLFPDFENVRATYTTYNYKLEWELNGKEYSLESTNISFIKQKMNKIIEGYHGQ